MMNGLVDEMFETVEKVLLDYGYFLDCFNNGFGDGYIVADGTFKFSFYDGFCISVEKIK